MTGPVATVRGGTRRAAAAVLNRTQSGSTARAVDGADEGAVYHGRTTANGAGQWTLAEGLTGGNATATATNTAGNTSQFSAPLALAAGPDADGDHVLDATDNCVNADNPAQENNDRNFIDNPDPYPDDVTRMHSDELGDVCDADDDNDGLGDTGGCIGDPDPFNSDTDGDRFLDGVECSLGRDPTNPNDYPPPIVLPDNDMDGVPDYDDPNDFAVDTDGDGLSDGIEYRFYQGAMGLADTDGDGCRDGREVASLNADQIVSSGDQGLLATGFITYFVNFDLNKDGVISSGDQGIMANRFGACP